MESAKKTILIPWDFSEKADYAFAHALNVSRVTGSSISILHIVKSADDIPTVTTQLEAVAESLLQKHGIKPVPVVRRGDLFKMVGATANELNAELIIMGTHGIKGMQKLMGSYALKTIVKSKVPFIVVQDFPKTNTFQKVVFPVDHRRESKEKIKWSGFLSSAYKCKYYIIHSMVNDRGLKKRLQSNLFFTKKYLDANRFEYEIKQAPGKTDFAKETVDFATEVNADLILIITTKNIFFFDYMLGASEQYIIANPAKVPVMCVNPKPGKFAGGFSAMGN
jgi:nucleotide-binding universal stress UspA family protein